MNEEELLSTATRMEWGRAMDALMAAIPKQGRATMQVAFDKAFSIGLEWRRALLARVNKDVSSSRRAADAPDEQQQGG